MTGFEMKTSGAGTSEGTLHLGRRSARVAEQRTRALETVRAFSFAQSAIAAAIQLRPAPVEVTEMQSDLPRTPAAPGLEFDAWRRSSGRGTLVTRSGLLALEGTHVWLTSRGFDFFHFERSARLI